MEESCHEIIFDPILAAVDSEVTQHPKPQENSREAKRRRRNETNCNPNPKRVQLFVSPDAINTVYPGDSVDSTPKLGASHKWGKQELDMLGVTFIEEPFDLSEITGDSDEMWSPELENCKIKHSSC